MKPKKATKMYIVQVHQSWGWVRSYNIGVKESYTDKEKAKDLAGIIKGLGLKVQTQIEGEKIKVTSAKKDDLQEVIQHLRGLNYSIPLSFCNYR